MAKSTDPLNFVTGFEARFDTKLSSSIFLCHFKNIFYYPAGRGVGDADGVADEDIAGVRLVAEPVAGPDVLIMTGSPSFKESGLLEGELDGVTSTVLVPPSSVNWLL